MDRYLMMRTLFAIYYQLRAVIFEVCEIWGSQGGEDDDVVDLDCDRVDS
jgi:hypothetical protein